MTVENLSLYRFLKRLEDMRLLMSVAQGNLDGINERAKKNVDNQKAINAMLAENKVRREELCNPKPVEKKRPALYIVK